jgi:hypothetical protein
MFTVISRMKKGRQTVFAIVIAFAVISFWRGIWGLQDEYLFPGNRNLSLWASVLIGLAILLIMHKAAKELP